MSKKKKKCWSPSTSTHSFRAYQHIKKKRKPTACGSRCNSSCASNKHGERNYKSWCIIRFLVFVLRIDYKISHVLDKILHIVIWSMHEVKIKLAPCIPCICHLLIQTRFYEFGARYANSWKFARSCEMELLQVFSNLLYCLLSCATPTSQFIILLQTKIQDEWNKTW